MKKLNPEEGLVGAVQVVAWSFFMSWWAIPAFFLSGYLWALGGADKTPLTIRRLGCSATIGIAVALGSWTLLGLLAIPLLFVSFTPGYGIPGWHSNGLKKDDGSPLGAFIYTTVCRGKPVYNDYEAQRYADILTRATLGLFTGLMAGVAFGFIDTIAWIIGTIVLAILYPLVVRLF